MLQLMIVIITMSAPNLDLIEQAYSGPLNYSVVDRGQVPEDLATVWDAPRMAGRDYLLMQPESKAPFYLRFVQVDAVDGYGPMKTFGWNATEILVQDPDGLAQKLREKDSLFQIVGEPRPLSATSNIRAMQVVGPAKEVLYLTRIPPHSPGDSGPAMASATTYVDRPFIVILGGPDINAIRSFYHDKFGFEVSEPGSARMTVLNKAHGYDIETVHPIAMARISKEFAIEIDGYPDAATTRPHRFGELPPSMSIVGFEVATYDGLESSMLAPAHAISVAPYEGREVAVLRGAAGERIELIKTRQD
jgi:hypothetical protein